MSWRDEPATLKQRMALENMFKRLGWSTVGIRDMTKAKHLWHLKTPKRKTITRLTALKRMIIGLMVEGRPWHDRTAIPHA